MRPSTSTLKASTSAAVAGPASTRSSKRTLPIRKQFLVQQYKHILQSNKLVVFLKPSDFSVAELTKLRVELSNITSNGRAPPPPSAASINDSTLRLTSSPTLTFLRPGLIPPTLRQLRGIPSATLLTHVKQSKGNLALLSLPTLDPPALKAALKAIKKLSETPNPRKQALAAAAGPGKGKASAAGSAGQENQERLSVVSALVEGKEMLPAEISGLANLPSLEQILAQLVGLLETPARQLLGISSQAAGGDLARTLEGFKVGLEDKDKGPEAPAS